MTNDGGVPQRRPHRPHKCSHLLPSPPAPDSPSCPGPQPLHVPARTGSSAWTMPGLCLFASSSRKPSLFTCPYKAVLCVCV